VCGRDLPFRGRDSRYAHTKYDEEYEGPYTENQRDNEQSFIGKVNYENPEPTERRELYEDQYYRDEEPQQNGHRHDEYGMNDKQSMLVNGKMMNYEDAEEVLENREISNDIGHSYHRDRSHHRMNEHTLETSQKMCKYKTGGNLLTVSFYNANLIQYLKLLLVISFMRLINIL